MILFVLPILPRVPFDVIVKEFNVPELLRVTVWVQDLSIVMLLEPVDLAEVLVGHALDVSVALA